ncbi:MAG TPA: Gldg family protein [Treponemataceae bacterium]|mgnify:CR=1 FL=1|nr:Gldg family protein [Treponemataceae bacterium]
MGTVRKIMNWLKGPKSDLFLFIVALVLLNLVSLRGFVRLDLTGGHSYSLSPASREVMRSLEEPLAIKVFFSGDLPAPYNSVGRYLNDLLVEYKGANPKRFSYESFDMKKEANQELARSYGIPMAQVQEVKDNEVGVKNAYMGLAIVYSDSVEVIGNVSTTEGLEYRLTTTIGKTVARTNTLAGLSGKVKLTLYASSSFAPLGLAGFRDLDRIVSDATAELNRKNLNRIEYAKVDPSSVADMNALAAKYGVEVVSWSTKAVAKGAASSPDGSGVLAIVLEYQDRFKTVPLELARNILGGYGIAGLDKLPDTLAAALQGLMANSPSVGYVTGHGEKSLSDERSGATRLRSIVADTYEFKEIDTAKDEIPENITTLVINGPTGSFTDAELYKIDQFVLRGGRLFALLDPFEEIQPQGAMAYYGGQPTYRPINSGLERLLKAYGITPERNYVLDKECYVARQQGQPDVKLYYVPRLGKEGLNRKHEIAKGLADVIFLQSSSLDLADAPSAKGRSIIPLATSSGESWLMEDNISLMPYGMEPPAADKLSKRTLAALAEGSFESAFGAAPPALAASTAGTKADANTAASSDEKPSVAIGSLDAKAHLAKSVLPGRVIVIGTSAITGPAVMDAEGREPVSIFVRNAIDYLAGNDDLIQMRTKGLSLDTLNKTTPAARTLARAVNLYGLPALTILLGLGAWRLRVLRRRRIAARYSQANGKREA